MALSRSGVVIGGKNCMFRGLYRPGGADAASVSRPG